MAPARPTPPSSGAGPRLPLGRPKIFGGGVTRSGRVEKRSAPESERARERKQEKSLGPTEADPEEQAQPQPARPEPESATTQSSPKATGRAYRDERGPLSTRAPLNTTSLPTNRGASADDREYESGESVLHHKISEGGPKLKNIAELLADADPHQNFRIPSNKIIANEDVDTRVYQQMRRLAPGGDLTPDRVRNNLIDSVRDFEQWWDLRGNRESRALFWKRVCKRSTWMGQLDGADCREFFLWLVVYFRHGSGKKALNRLAQAFEGLSELFEKEKGCELDELVSIEARVRLPAHQPPSRSRAAVSKKRDSKFKPVDGNIFRLSGNTNMTDDELRGVDVQGLRRIVDLGDRRRKKEDRMRVFEEEMGADRARMAEEGRRGSGRGSQRAGRKRSSRKRPTPFEAGRKPSDFEEDMYGDEDDDVDVDDNNEEERLRAAALNRQRWPRE
ncbi:hypothetical protein F5883DRAFT_636839 [Diaporthe sp. PMI_573]|nr:hypothetical protein F5883DRAFT_636839 [Diaporthaceae sp. PMI_573]